MTVRKVPELDGIAQQIADKDFHDLPTHPLRAEVLKIHEMRKQTKALEALLSHLVESGLAPR